jgi:hypothetical protein
VKDEAQLKTADEPPPILHPSMADLTAPRSKNSPPRFSARTLEASEMLRGLIEAIILTPQDGQLRIELRGDLAAMLAAAQPTERWPETGGLHLPIQIGCGGVQPPVLAAVARGGVRAAPRIDTLDVTVRRLGCWP